MVSKLTASQAAGQTRASIKAKLERIRARIISAHIRYRELVEEIDEAIKFIEGQADRNTARKGGLGRK